MQTDPKSVLNGILNTKHANFTMPKEKRRCHSKRGWQSINSLPDYSSISASMRVRTDRNKKTGRRKESIIYISIVLVSMHKYVTHFFERNDKAEMSTNTDYSMMQHCANPLSIFLSTTVLASRPAHNISHLMRRSVKHDNRSRSQWVTWMTLLIAWVNATKYIKK